MKPKTLDTLHQQAMAMGAKVLAGGRVVNASRAQVERRAPVPPPPAPAPAYMPPVPAAPPAETIPAVDPVLKETVIALDRFASANFLLNETNTELAKSLAAAVKTLSEQEPEKRPVRWDFKIHRDAHGLMERIQATAVFK